MPDDLKDPRGNLRRLGVLISGRGSNLQSLIDAVAAGHLNASIAVVISNLEDAHGLERARRAGIEAICLSHRGWPSRDEYDGALVRELQQHHVDLVCLAGFMRVLGPAMIDAFPNRIVNIHPSLLPAFRGVDAQRQALEQGVKVAGVTVHLVTSVLDGGPIILQRAVPVLDDDSVATLSARILAEEHRAYPEAVKILLDEPWTIEGRRFVRPRRVDEASRAPLQAGN
jgi:phosphoribosylglycinamide formyltransferase-1